MFSIIAATLIATASSSGDLSLQRMDELDNQLPKLCLTASKMAPSKEMYTDTLYLYTGAETNAEKYFVLSVCGAYIKGMLEGTPR